MADPRLLLPCFCGSGRSYGACCGPSLRSRRAGQADPEAEARAVLRGVAWVRQHAPSQYQAVTTLLPLEERYGSDANAFLANLIAYDTTGEDGTPCSVRFLADESEDLPHEELRYFVAGGESWFSTWEVLEVRPEEGLRLRDLLTGEERDVRERLATRSLAPRDVLLARVVREGLAWTLAGTHPRSLPPREAAAVIEILRKVRGLGSRRLRPADLQGDAAIVLACAWERVVKARDDAPTPQLVNTDGEPLLLTTDRFTFDPAACSRVCEALRALTGADVEGPGGAGDTITLLRPGNRKHPSWENTVVARIRVARDSLEVETNSTARADAARQRVEEACPGLLRHEKRSQTSGERLMRARTRGPVPRTIGVDGVPTAEQARIVREFKARQYAAWPDEPLPALGGLTPREAARRPRGRARDALELVLREIENLEAREPQGERFDVATLRAELGLPT